MIEITGNLFDPLTYRSSNPLVVVKHKPDAIVITTNGFTKTNGMAVMGRGCAKQAATQWPSLPKDLAILIKKNGNIAQEMFTTDDIQNPFTLVSFPVKPISEPYNGTNVVRHMRNQFAKTKSLGLSRVPGWACIANIPLIRKSAAELIELADQRGWEMVVLPRPGCGAGERSWDDIGPMMHELLDNRFYCITY